jgi:hypothetical protein
LPLNQFGSESELAGKVLERLEPWFHIQREITGLHCSGQELRVDAMIRPRDALQWRDPDVAFGIEFKIPEGDVRSYTRWLAQTISYTHVDWRGYGRRIVLTCPGAASWLDDDTWHQDGRRDFLIAKRLSGQLGVGELVLRWGYGLTILVNDGRVWSERGGLGVGRTWALKLPAGHR